MIFKLEVHDTNFPQLQEEERPYTHHVSSPVFHARCCGSSCCALQGVMHVYSCLLLSLVPGAPHGTNHAWAGTIIKACKKRDIEGYITRKYITVSGYSLVLSSQAVAVQCTRNGSQGFGCQCFTRVVCENQQKPEVSMST